MEFLALISKHIGRKIFLPDPSRSQAYSRIWEDSPENPMSLVPDNEFRKSSRASATFCSSPPFLKRVSRRKARALVDITEVAAAQSKTTCREMLSMRLRCSSQTTSVPYNEDVDWLCCKVLEVMEN